MKKKDLFELLKSVNDNSELYVNIFNENKECLPNSVVMGGTTYIKGISKNGDKIAIDIQM